MEDIVVQRYRAGGEVGRDGLDERRLLGALLEQDFGRACAHDALRVDGQRMRASRRGTHRRRERGKGVKATRQPDRVAAQYELIDLARHALTAEGLGQVAREHRGTATFAQPVPNCSARSASTSSNRAGCTTPLERIASTERA